MSRRPVAAAAPLGEVINARREETLMLAQFPAAYAAYRARDDAGAVRAVI